MHIQLSSEVRKDVKYWWISLISGILAFILGFWCMVTPDQTLVALTYLFVTILLIGGIFEIVFAVSNRSIMSGWGWILSGGILEIILGLLIVSLPVYVMTGILIYLIGFWMLFRSIWMIGESVDLKHFGLKGWGWLLALAVLGVIFSLIYFLSPVYRGVFIISFMSIAFFMYGIFRISVAFRLRSLGKRINHFKYDNDK